MKTLGVCIGASSISVVGLEKKNNKITKIFNSITFHNGDSKGKIKEIFSKLDNNFYDRICVTGRKFRKFVNLTSITEPEAVEYSIQHLIKDKLKYNALISAGGETILVYQLDKNGRIFNVFTGNKCASGTGSFFIQQLGRMALKIEDLKDTYDENSIYDISGRCSVFCKSDCTHALNKGQPKDNVIAGLCKMMAVKITELLNTFNEKNLIVTGGISKIKPIMKFVESSIDTLYIPEESDYFEAYGAALWALDNETKPFPGLENLIEKGKSSFTYLKSLKQFEHLVSFKKITYSKAKENDICILGVDIGSTTTKAVLIKKDDDSILASTYLKTDGNPISAVKKCYKNIEKQLNGVKVKIIGLGTTGSGRQIAGLHALTESIYNEIICHAAASIYFDKDVDTIFEIGGQDAKYTYVTQGVPSDYAMNEACSAGTGSFLEEAAKESLNVDVKDIAEISLRSNFPPNFNDQCAAFISSDISTAFQEGIAKEDIVAGLVYSICHNYNNRVRGARPYGKKIFMQGGVCYNKAVPIAMASLLNANIIVPPEPGLMGAFGCAIEVKKRLEKKLLKENFFELAQLYKREIKYGKNFICSGGKEKCDRKCSINMIEVEGKKIPFGGACNKYYNLRHNIEDNSFKYDLVAVRDRMLFEEFAVPSGKTCNYSKTIGINRTFLTNMLYPLYFNFWDQLGFKVVLSDDITTYGREKRKSAFCYPAEIAHGAFDNLLSKNVDYIFMPHILHIPVYGSAENNKACVFVQGEPYYLKQAFKDQKIPEILIPVIDFQRHVDSTKNEFVRSAVLIGLDKNQAKNAFDFALNKIMEYFKKAWSIGKKTIEDLEKNKNEFAVVMMGRWYNALAKESNMSIPHKFATRKITVIPFDFIPFDYEHLGIHMHWGIGKIALQVSKFVKKHPQLFAVYITNFSCGPDSFIVPYFRDEMGKKPSLTLELDSHTADVGLNTRIEAAIDIIKYYRQLNLTFENDNTDFMQAATFYKGNKVYYKDSKGKIFNFKDKEVTFLFPMMGQFLTEAGIAALKGDGFNAKMVNEPDFDVLNLGKANSSCKECLPYIVMAGSLLDYVKRFKKTDEKVAYFIVGDPAPCRVEQYQVGFKKIIEKHRLQDVAILVLSSTEGFAGMGLAPLLKVWQGFCIADVMEQIYSVILTIAKDKEKALKIFNEEWDKILLNLGKKENITLTERLKMTSLALSKIQLKMPIDEANRITVTGEMYVRNEPFCRQRIEEKLSELGFITKFTPLTEWHYYIDYIIWKNYAKDRISYFKRFFFLIKRSIQSNIEKKIKKIFTQTGLYEYDPVNIKSILKTSDSLVDKRLIGDVGITIGVGLRDSLNDSSGIISLGPFACIQTRMAEAILNNNMTVEGKISVNKDSIFGENINQLDKNMPLPYLAIESDGNPYPQIVEARLEVFALQAKRIGEMMKLEKKRKAELLKN
ncbi:MAG: activase [Spirochaetes bacterium]|nr:activase [Spirochaetota bacterium]